MNAVWLYLKSSVHHNFSGTVKWFNSGLSSMWAQGIRGWCAYTSKYWRRGRWPHSSSAWGQLPLPGPHQGFPQHLTATALVLPQGTPAPGESFILSKKHVLRGWLQAFLQKYWLFFFSALSHYNFHIQEDFGERRQYFSLPQAVSWGCLVFLKRDSQD